MKKKKNLNQKTKCNKIFVKLIIFEKLYSIIIKQVIIYLFIVYIYKTFSNKIMKNKKYLDKNKYEYNNSLLIGQIESDYKNNIFVIIRDKCKTCGLFAFYIHYLGCSRMLLSQGYIPIVDLKTFPNIFNGFNTSSLSQNPWEIYFNQPFGYTLENVIKKTKNIKFFLCNHSYPYPSNNIYKNKVLIDYWHNIALKYASIKNKYIKEATITMNNLFKGSNNILGVLARGTDYIARQPKSHPKQPNIKIILRDVKNMNEKNKYDWIFLTTEDYIIRLQFIQIFGNKLKYSLKNKNIKYNYKSKEMLCYNKNIKGNIEYMEIYLINIIILSKCIDIITSRTNGSIGAFIFTEGFRNTKVYYLGIY